MQRSKKSKKSKKGVKKTKNFKNAKNPDSSDIEEPSWLRQSPNHVLINCRVKPNSKESFITVILFFKIFGKYQFLGEDSLLKKFDKFNRGFLSKNVDKFSRGFLTKNVSKNQSRIPYQKNPLRTSYLVLSQPTTNTPPKKPRIPYLKISKISKNSKKFQIFT